MAMAGILQTMEWDAKYRARERKRDRRRKRQRELSTLPKPTERWIYRGYVIEAFVVKNRRVRAFARPTAYFRFGTLRDGGCIGTFSRSFDLYGASVFLKLLDRVEHWLNLDAHTLAPAKIPRIHWMTSIKCIDSTPQEESSFTVVIKGVGCSSETRMTGTFKSVTSHQLTNRRSSAHHEAFFQIIDLCAVRELLDGLSVGQTNLLFETYQPDETHLNDSEVKPVRMKTSKRTR